MDPRGGGGSLLNTLQTEETRMRERGGGGERDQSGKPALWRRKES